jgi:nicotinate-nucleotide adenylyltransferase
LTVPKKIVGLLGGSFNPAHLGHVHISREAKKRLGLSEIWWLVSPQNPLKETKNMAPFSKRFASAKAITQKYPFIHISDFEQRLNTRYTVDTLRQLKKHYPHTRFVWLMGGDNLASIHRWHHWQEIFKLVSILVLDRSPFSHSAMRSPAALRFASARVRPHLLLAQNQPSWAYAHMRKSPESSTQIRAAASKSK